MYCIFTTVRVSAKMPYIIYWKLKNNNILIYFCQLISQFNKITFLILYCLNVFLKFCTVINDKIISFIPVNRFENRAKY